MAKTFKDPKKKHQPNNLMRKLKLYKNKTMDFLSGIDMDKVRRVHSIYNDFTG